MEVFESKNRLQATGRKPQAGFGVPDCLAACGVGLVAYSHAKLCLHNEALAKLCGLPREAQRHRAPIKRGLSQSGAIRYKSVHAPTQHTSGLDLTRALAKRSFPLLSLADASTAFTF